jgi:hypothetical protein
MKQLLTIILSVTFLICNAQKTSYKEYEVCTDSTTYKGKKNHGKFHCTAWSIVRKYNDGRIDTVDWMPSVQMFIGDELSQYEKLSERGKYIIDSLQEDGLSYYQQDYLLQEPHYMRADIEIYNAYRIIGTDVFVYRYKIWNNANGNGFKIIKETIVK